MRALKKPIKLVEECQISCQQQAKGQMSMCVLGHMSSLSPAAVFAQGWAQVHNSTPLFARLEFCASACYHIHQ